MGRAYDPMRGTQNAGAAMATGYLTVLALILGLGFWGSRVEISGAVVAPAMVRVQNNRQVIQHPTGGVVSAIQVRDGDRVSGSQVLVRLDDTETQLKLGVVQNQLDEISIRIARFTAEKSQQKAITYPPELWSSAHLNPDLRAKLQDEAELFQARRDLVALDRETLAAQISQTKEGLGASAVQVAALSEQKTLIKQELKNQLALRDRGLAQSSKLLELQTNLARIAGLQGKLDADMAQMSGQISTYGIELQRQVASAQEQAITRLRGLQFSREELLGKKQELLMELAALDIRSPVDGIVYASQVFATRSVIQPGENLMYIVPQDQPLVIAARVEAGNVDQIYPGQGASLWFTAFEQSENAAINGAITKISADVIVDPDYGTAYYAVELTPNPGEIERFKAGTILPGMPVQAFITTGDRSPLSYLSKPFMDYFRKAFRE